ncbi:hypothetical protein K1719_033580 [Acacia pycnantha]|nr:hypothetical protein K1719_033580 [Acacia pycnantha]
MDSNWRPTQGTESNMDTSDWRTQLQPDSRQRIVNRITDTLKRDLPVSGQDDELRKIAQRFEEKIYAAAPSQSDYVRKISLKMQKMENKTQNTMVNAMQSNAGGPSNKPIDSGIPMQSQVHNPGQSHAIPVPNQSQSRQQLLSQNIQNNIAPPVSNIGQTPIQNVVGPNSNMQNNMFGGSQRQMPPRQQVVPQQQQQQQSQKSQMYLYQQQQLQQQNLKHKIQPGNIQHSLMQPHIQMQQQQQPNQLQSSQSSVMQTSSIMQPSITKTSLPSLQRNQQANNVQQSIQPMLQQHFQSVIRQEQQQTSINNQQQTPISQKPITPPQQQQLLAPQSNVTSIQHPQLLGQQNKVGDMQQHQRLLVGQQNSLPKLQQHQQQQPHLINRQNNLSNIHQQQLGSNVPGLRQQQLLARQSGNSGMQPNQHSAHMVQKSKVSVQQQSHQNVTNLLQSQGQQSQPQAPQQQLMPQIQSQPAQMQQQPNLLQRDMQQRIQGSSSLLQQQNVLDQQKQLYQSQRNLPDSSSTSLDSTAQTGKSGGDDWQEEVFQKIKSMKESYLRELTEMHQKIAAKLQLHEPLPHQAKSEQLEKLKIFKTMLERLIAFLQVSKGQIVPVFKEKMASCEKQIINFINTNRRKRAMSFMQSGQLPPHHMQLASQPQSQPAQIQSHENQLNPQMQSANLQSSVATMPQSSMASLQHNSIPSISGVSTTQQNMINSMQPGANLESSSLNSLQQVGASTLQQNSVNAPQQTNTNHLSSQGGGRGSVPQQNSNPLQPGSIMPQHQQLKQPQELQILQNQQHKHLQQRQLLQRQQMMQHQQQLQQATKQQVPAHMQTHQVPTLHQINDIKMRQGLGVKPGPFQQHLPSGQRSAYPQQQFKSGGSYPISSPHLLQAASPQIPQHSSPQVDQQNLPSLAKASTPPHSANSPFVGPTPSPTLAPSPMPGDSEKPISVVSTISNTANVGHQQTGIATVPAQSLAIGTPGISPSPLLAEFSGPDGAHANALAAPSAKLTVTELPIERLTKAVKALSSKDLSAAVSGIASVVSMMDRIPGSAPGNGFRAAVDEDLVAMTKCHLRARNFINQYGTNGTKRMRRYVSAMPLNIVSSPDCMNDSMKQLNALEAVDLDSATTATFPRLFLKNLYQLPKLRPDPGDPTIFRPADAPCCSAEPADLTSDLPPESDSRCSVAPDSGCSIALDSDSPPVLGFSTAPTVLDSTSDQGPTILSPHTSSPSSSSPIQPLRLLVPTNYPNCSFSLDKYPVESKESLARSSLASAYALMVAFSFASNVEAICIESLLNSSWSLPAALAFFNLFFLKASSARMALCACSTLSRVTASKSSSNTCACFSRSSSNLLIWFSSSLLP